MTPRPRKHALPDNLTYDQPSGRFRYRNPETGARTWFGRDRNVAIERARQANEAMRAIRAQRDTAAGLPPTVARVIDLYAVNVIPRKPWDDGTRKNHQFALQLYRREFGGRLFGTVDRVFLADWLERRCTTADAYNKHRARLIDLWRYAIARRWVDFNEAEATMARSGSRKLAANRKVRQRLTTAAYWAIHDHPDTPPWLRIAMEASLVTLQARAEVCGFKRSDTRDGWLYVIRDKVAGDSDMAFIRIQLTPQIEDIWRRAWADDIPSPYLVHYRPASMRPQHQANKPHWTAITPGYLTRAFKAARDATGLFEHLEPRQRPTFHEIRSLGARAYRAMGYPEAYISALMTHTDTKTTEIYLRNPEALRPEHYRQVAAELTLAAVPEL